MTTGRRGAAEPVTPKADVRAERRALRRRIVANRDLTADAQALAIHGIALAVDLGVRAGDSVTLYVSRPLEPPVDTLAAGLADRGIRVLVPLTLPDLDLDWSLAEPTTAASYAAASGPLGKDAVTGVALAYVPALAADRMGNRLGQGGGCYDRVIPRLRPGTPVVAVLHPGELLGDDDAAVPTEPHDRPVGWVLTAHGATRLGQAAYGS